MEQKVQTIEHSLAHCDFRHDSLYTSSTFPMFEKGGLISEVQDDDRNKRKVGILQKNGKWKSGEKSMMVRILAVVCRHSKLVSVTKDKSSTARLTSCAANKCSPP
jgi:hypothetical protein